MTDPTYAITAGSADLLGAHPLGDGVSFAVFSAHAEKIEICLFSPDGAREIQRLTLPDRLGDIWHGFVPGLPEGALYGLRAHGPYEPQLGHRFNPAKLLIDPYARRLSGRVIPDDALLGYDSHTAQADMSIDHRDWRVSCRNAWSPAIRPPCRVAGAWRATAWSSTRPTPRA